MATPTTSQLPAAGTADGTSERAEDGRRGRRPSDQPQRCLQADCDIPAFSDGLCPLHGLQKYYRELGSRMEAQRAAGPTEEPAAGFGGHDTDKVRTPGRRP